MMSGARAFTLLLSLSGGCVHADAPLRPLVELPPAPARDLPIQSEQELWAHLTQLVDAANLLPGGGATLVLDEAARVPMADASGVRCRHFLHGDVALLDTLTAYGQALGGLEPDWLAWPVEQRREAGLALYAALLTRGLAATLAEGWESAGRGDPWVDQTRAIALEQAVLARLVELGQLPALWPQRWAEVQRALLESAPAELRAQIPDDPEQRAELVRRAWEAPQSWYSPPGADAEAPPPAGPQTTLAHLTLLVIALESAPPSLDDAAALFAPDPQAALLRVLEVAQALEGEGVGFTVGAPFADGVLLSADEGRWSGSVHLGASHQDLRVRWDREVALPPARRAGVLELLNEANILLIGPGVYLQDQALIYYGPAESAGTEDDVALALLESLAEARRWLDPVALFAEGALELEAARARLAENSGEMP